MNTCTTADTPYKQQELASNAIWCLPIIIILFLAQSAFAQQNQGPPPLVGIETIDRQNANKPKKHIGHVEAIESVNLLARVEGYLEKFNFQEGSYVQAGQLLYVIEQPPYKARVNSAQAKITQAQAELFKAETRLRRLRAASRESVRQTDIDDAVAAKNFAEGKLREAEANLDTAKIDLDYTTIEAPIDGRVGKSFYKKGDLVGPSAGPLAEIVRMDPVRVVFSVSESQISTIQNAFSNNGRLDVRIKTPGGSSFREGKIEFVDNKVDSKLGTISVWARVDNPKGKLIPGEYVNVFLQSSKENMQPAVSQVAVQRDKDGAFVYVLGEDNKVQQRRIQTGKAIGDKYIIESGLSKGEKVVVQGIQKISPGMNVNIQPEGKEDN
ncbi:MAG: efflux RND transporter periplasmic adaptor subunit [Thermodesulfobacteriota bacterium]